MQFTLDEWNFIKHCIEVAAREFDRQSEDCTPSDKENSMYRIFRRQYIKAQSIISDIENTPL